MLKRQRLWLLVAPVVVHLLDAGLPLRGQPSGYWQPGRTQVNELSPEANQLLHIHPAAFLGGTAAWITIYSSLILLLPRWPAMVVAATVTIGHTEGAFSWVRGFCPYYYQACNVLCLVPALLIVSTFTCPEPASAMGGEARRRSLFLGVRLVVIALLAAVAVYLFAVPH
jgi:amino acid transporter